jgi:cell wall-associated NlpC family hydrolase
MKRLAIALWCVALAHSATGADEVLPASGSVALPLEQAIKKNLGRPYAMGSTGSKSYDCSGFVWRVMTDAGVFIKRSTARKYYFAMPKVEDGSANQYAFGQLVFFDDLKHVGIVDSHHGFFHAETGHGTRRSKFEPYWRGKVVGFRAIPRVADSATPASGTEQP